MDDDASEPKPVTRNITMLIGIAGRYQIEREQIILDLLRKLDRVSSDDLTATDWESGEP